ncbi:MAG: hypothetical protein R3B96_14405 [Pirellulaceae bacterium]
MIVKGVSDEHGRLLRMMGVERVVFPEKEFAAHLGKQLAYPNVLDLIPLDDDYSLVEMAVPESLVGKSLGQAELKRKLGVWVMGVKETGRADALAASHRFRAQGDQILLAAGRSEQLDRLRKMR